MEGGVCVFNSDGWVSSSGAGETGGGETARLRGVCGELSGWGAFPGCSSGSRYVLCHFSAAARGLERGRAGDSVVVDRRVDGGVAVALHVSGCSTGGRGMDWGEPGAVGGFLAIRS
jgi:hypothetical protein